MYKRKAAFAGQFYSSDPDELKSQILSFLDKSNDSDINDLSGVISPHAGYIYSGQIAAYSYKQISKNDYDIAVILAPSHRAYFDGASVIPEGEYETPLGNLNIYSKICNQLVNENFFCFADQLEEVEHSLEVQIPFLKVVKPEIEIIPVIIGTQNSSVISSIADTLYKYLSVEKKSFIVIMSSDLSHFHPYNNANNIDTAFIDSLLTCDESIISESILSGKTEACGSAAIITQLKYANSGDTAGDKNKVVGYLSAAVQKII